MINESTLRKLKEGDDSVIDTVIEAYLTLAEKIARYYGHGYPTKADDIHSVALLGLCKAINNIKNGRMTTDNFKAYINNTIRGHIKHFLQQDHLVHLPNWYLAERLKDRNFRIPMAFTIDRRDSNDDEDVELTFEIAAPDPGDRDFINEFYEKLTNFERIVLDLRSEGHTLVEISEHTGKSKTWIEKTLLKIKDKMIRERRQHGR